MTPDYYTLLGVAPGAEDEIIRAAYLVLAKRYHPDTATAASPHNVEKFRLIAEAYEVLRDPRRRANYDWCHEQNLAQQIQGERSQEEQEHREVRAPGKSTWARAIDNPLVYPAGAVALVVALVFGLIKVIANGPSANTDVAMRTEKSERSSSFLSDKAALQELTDLRRTLHQTERLAATNQESLVQERARRQGLEKQLATRGDNDKLLAQERARSQELEKQLATRGDNDKLLAQERARSQGLEKQLAARGDNDKLLAQERARSQELEKQLAARQHATPAPGPNVIASLSDTSHPTPPPATNEPATAPLPRSDKPVIPAVDNPATLAARPEAPGNPEAAGLMARARVLLGQGNIGVARIVLERAAEMGSAPALFTLAETYDPAILSAWGTLGTQGDVGKARELYAKAFASGVREAKDRLNALRY
jgi:curved DNA-binding protein CbpA